MSSTYQCPSCHAQFDDQTAYCEDWRIPEKKFGCPNCHTFFKKSVAPMFKETSWWFSVYYLLSVLVFIVVVLWPETVVAIPYANILVALNFCVVSLWHIVKFSLSGQPWYQLTPYE